MRIQDVAAILFLVVYSTFLFIELPEYGLTWDMYAEYPRVAAYADYMLEGIEHPSELDPSDRTPWHELSYAAAKRSNHTSANGCLPSLLAAFSGKLFFQKLRWLGPIDSYHLGLVLLWLACLGYLYLQLASVHGSTTALLAIVILGLAPGVLGHVPNNMKDLPSAAFLALALVEWLRALRSARGTSVLLSAFFFGCAISAKFTALPGIAVAAVSLLASLLRRDRDVRYGPRFWISVASAPFVAVSVLVAHWPHLWVGPHEVVTRLQNVLAIGGARQLTNAPWTLYPLELTVVTTPPLVLLLALWGLVIVLARAFSREREWGGMIYPVWLLVILGSWSTGKVFLFDGIRNFIHFWPALAILAAIGGASILRAFARLEGTRRLWLEAGAGLTIGVGLIAPVALYHPHEITYFNSMIGGIQGAQNWKRSTVGVSFEACDYWASSLRQAHRWANEHLPKGAYVTFGAPRHIGPYYQWRADLSISPSPPRSPDVQHYALILQRPTHFGQCERYAVRSGVPVYEERVRGVPLATLYRLNGDCGPCHQHGVRSSTPRPVLTLSPSALSISAPTGIDIEITGDDALGGREYAILLSAKVMESQLGLAPDENPLESDELTHFVERLRNGPGLVGFAGHLDRCGKGRAKLGPFPSEQSAPWLGRHIFATVAVRDCRGWLYSDVGHVRVVE